MSKKPTAPAASGNKEAKPQALAKTTSQSLQPGTQPHSNVPQASADFFEATQGMGTGHENVTARDLIIPRLTILQGLSPQVTQGKAEFDPDARVGMIYDVGLKERFPDGIQFLPVHYLVQWLEWAPRNTGKGLQRIHDSDKIMNETQPNERKVPALKNGNLIIQTAQLYGFNITANSRPSFLPMSSTQLKKARFWMTLSTGEKVMLNGQEVTPPLWYRVYNLTTVPESNAEGNWMGWKIERGPRLEDHPNWRSIVASVKAFRASVATGRVRGDLSDAVDTNAPHDDSAPM